MNRAEKILESMISKAVDKTIIKMHQLSDKKTTLKEELEATSKQTENLSREDKFKKEQRLLAGIGEEDPPTKVHKGMLTDQEIHQRSIAFEDDFDGILVVEAKWSTKFINDLPDDAFAFIKGGGQKDAENRTFPRDLRYLPFKNADGKIDSAHLRNALARLSQTDLSDAEKKKAEAVLKKAAKEAKVGEYRETLTEDQKKAQRALCLDEAEAIKDSRDNFVEVRAKLRTILRETKNNAEVAVIWADADKALVSIFDPMTSRDTKFLEVSYVLEGEKIRITKERDVSKWADLSLKNT